MSGEATTSSAQLPKLTVAVFDHPDCPEWAKYAAIDKDGEGFYYEDKPECYGETAAWFCRCKRSFIIKGVYDASDWRHSLIERIKKNEEQVLPDWCKVDAMGWHKRCGYFKIIYIDDVSKRVDIQQVGEKSRGYFSFHTIRNETVQAKLRPYNEEEMQGLVGKVLDLDGSRDLVTSYDAESELVYADAMWMNSDELLSNGYTIDGERCGIMEHLEDGEWVE